MSTTTLTASRAEGEKVSNPAAHTLKRRPWRRHITNFEDILHHPYRGEGTAEAPYIIEWLPQDHENPQTWGEVYKWTVTMIVAISTLAVALASSAYSGAVKSVIETFGSSREVVTLGVSLFVLGFAIGPLLWAPMSELFGRRNVFIGTYIMFTLFNSVAASSQNIQSLLIYRFFAGSFGSSPLTNAGGTVADVFNAKERGLGMAIFAAAPFLGPSLGPIVGGFLGDAGGFRWVQGLLGIFSAILTVVGLLWIPETYAPCLLRRRAASLQKITGKHYRAPMDAKKPVDVKELFKVALSRPWKLLFLEPIVLLLSTYMAIVYGTLYMLFSAFPIVYQENRGWNAGVGGLAFLGVLVGMLLGVAWIIAFENDRYVRVVERCGGRAPPEARLPTAIAGGVLLVIGLVWFTASCTPNVHWIVSIIGAAPFGCGMVLVFLSLMNYLIDSYVIYAASVLAANSVLRSLFGAAFPLFTSQMYHNLGLQWASSIPTFLAAAMLPFPILFYKYGHLVRERCKYAAEAEEALNVMLGVKPNTEKAAPRDEETQ